MSEVLVGHQVICLNNFLNIIAMYANGNTHDQVLWSLGDFAIEAEEVRAFECFEAEVLVVEISVINDSRVELVCMSHNALVGSLGNHGRGSIVSRVDIVIEVGDDRRELLFRLLVKIRHRNTCSKYGIVWVGNSHVRGRLSGLSVCQHGVEEEKTAGPSALTVGLRTRLSSSTVVTPW